MAQPYDLDRALTDLAQHLGDTAFTLRVIVELRATADNLMMPLEEELRRIRTLINRLLPRLP